MKQSLFHIYKENPERFDTLVLEPNYAGEDWPLYVILSTLDGRSETLERLLKHDLPREPVENAFSLAVGCDHLGNSRVEIAEQLISKMRKIWGEKASARIRCYRAVARSEGMAALLSKA